MSATLTRGLIGACPPRSPNNHTALDSIPTNESHRLQPRPRETNHDGAATERQDAGARLVFPPPGDRVEQADSNEEIVRCDPCGARAFATLPAHFGPRGHGGRHPSRQRVGYVHGGQRGPVRPDQDRKSTRLNSSHLVISYAVFCLKKKKKMIRCVHSLSIVL